MVEIRARDRVEDILDSSIWRGGRGPGGPGGAGGPGGELPLLTEEGDGPVVVGDWIVQVTPHMEAMSSQFAA